MVDRLAGLILSEFISLWIRVLGGGGSTFKGARILC